MIAASMSHARTVSERRPIRLMFLVRQLNTGGAQRQLVELIRALDRSTFEITVVTVYPGGEFESSVAGISDVRLLTAGRSSRWDVLSLVRLLRLARTVNPELVYSFLPLANILAVLLKPLLPRARVAWGVRASGADPRVARAGQFLERLLSRFADRIIFNSEAGFAHHVEKGFPPTRGVVVRNGIDVTSFLPFASGDLVRQSWSLGKKDVVFGVVGRVDPMKDQMTFIRAAALLRGRVPRARFVIIGPATSAYADDVRAEVTRLGMDDAVVFPGFTDVTAETYAALDVVASSSASEGFPNAVAEAMACGRRCVVTNVGDSAQIVGQYGLVVPPGNPPALADAMLRVLDLDFDPDAAARSIADRYAIELLARRTSDVLLSLRS